MEIKKIIETLRHCGSHQECYNCPLEGKAAEDCMKIMLDAADALEECMKRENAPRSLIDGRGDPVSCNVDAILKGEYE